MEEDKKISCGIKKLTNSEVISFDFLQDSSNRILVNKINEIIDYLDNQIQN